MVQNDFPEAAQNDHKEVGKDDQQEVDYNDHQEVAKNDHRDVVQNDYHEVVQNYEGKFDKQVVSKDYHQIADKEETQNYYQGVIQNDNQELAHNDNSNVAKKEFQVNDHVNEQNSDIQDVTTDEYQNNVTASEVRNVQQKDTLSNDDNSKFAPKDEQIKAQYTVEDFPQNLTLLNLNQESYRTELEVSGVDQIRNKKLSNVHDLDLVTKNSSQVTTANGNTTLGIVSETAITEPIKPSHQEITRTEFFDQTTSPTLNDEASQTSTTSLTTLKDSADYSSSKGGATFEKMAVEATGTETPSLGIGSFAHRLTPVFH